MRILQKIKLWKFFYIILYNNTYRNKKYKVDKNRNLMQDFIQDLKGNETRGIKFL